MKRSVFAELSYPLVLRPPAGIKWQVQFSSKEIKRRAMVGRLLNCNLSKVLPRTADCACNYSRYKRHAGKRRTGLNKYSFKTNIWIKETPPKCKVDLYPALSSYAVRENPQLVSKQLHLGDWEFSCVHFFQENGCYRTITDPWVELRSFFTCVLCSDLQMKLNTLFKVCSVSNFFFPF